MNNNNNESSIKSKGLVLEQYVQGKHFKPHKYPLKYYNSSKSLSAFSATSIRRRSSRSNGKIRMRKSKQRSNVDNSPKSIENPPTNTSSGTYIAKSIIEKALRKIDGVLTDFTEKNISKLGAAGSSSNSPSERISSSIRQMKTRPRSGILKSSDQRQQMSSTGRLRQEEFLSNLPPHIVDLMRMDSTSSIKKSKDKKYHSTKMTLKQAGNSGQSSYTPKSYSKSLKIYLVSAPLQLQLEKENTSLVPKKPILKSTGRSYEPYKVTRRNSRTTTTSAAQKPTDERQSTPLNKNDKTNETAGSYVPSVKKSLKSQIGVENGVAFVMGTKVKQQFYNSFGEAKDYGRDPSNRKWVVSIGSFQDNEISLELIDDTLKIKGCCQTASHHPEEQADYVMIKIPSDLDFNSLRVYRSANTHEFLILEEIWKKSHTLRFIE